MSIFGKIGHAIAKPFVLLAHLLFGTKGLEALSSAVKELLKTDLGKIAWAAVKAASGIADNSLARQTAFNSIRVAVDAAGHEVKDSVINLAIELLVQHLKDTIGADSDAAQ
jgi:hypothetical protein